MNKTSFCIYTLTTMLLLSAVRCRPRVSKLTVDKKVPAILSKAYGRGVVSGPEDFEEGSKDTFQLGSVKLKTGPWLFDDAILARADSDARFYKQSVRIRNHGAITTQFNIQGISDIKVNHAVYDGDKPSDWQLWMSQDGGRTFRQVGKTVTAASHTLTPVVFSINSNKSLRFEIRKVSGGSNRINIDNVIFYDPVETNENSTNVP